jgi:putative peptide zinc metalloprotease protein
VPVDRPTFSESWYRVSELTPQLLGAVNVYRQHFRGRRWYVLQDPASNQFFRLNDAAYYFVAMLDGRRTVRQVWHHCVERWGDAAPTQGEVIHLLGRLHASNLLQGDLAPDAEALFKRYQRQRWRKVRGLLTSLLFVRIPLWNPDRFLDRWAGVCGRCFTRTGGFIWGAIIAAGLWSVGGHTAELARSASGILDPANLPLLYLALVVVKLLHEMGHAFACKHFGRQAGSGGEVHQMGVTLLVFTPLPFVDTSSAWALRSKGQRVVVGACGMLVELAVASLAGILWSQTAEGTTLHAVAYNMVFIAGVSALIFNGNPLLRYDAYYILLDLLEIPNLESRSRLYVGYLVKRYLWGVSQARDPSHSRGEQRWLVFYAAASTICRVIVFGGILLFLGQSFFSIGVLAAAVLFSTWTLIPLANLIRYLCTSPELDRRRGRAFGTTATAAVALLLAVGWVRVPDRCRIEGVVEPKEYSIIHMQTAGFVRSVRDSGCRTGPGGPPLIEASSPDLETQRVRLLAELRQLQVQRQSAQIREPAQVQITDEKMAALQEQIERIDQELQGLALRSPLVGTWVAPDSDRMTGRYLPRGRRIGVVANLDDLRIRAVAGQDVAGRLIKEATPLVDIRVKGRPDIEMEGRIETIIPAGQERLPSAALGYAAGGSTQTDMEDPSGRRTAEPFFEILVAPSLPETGGVRPGQTMVLRFETSPKSLLAQGWRTLLQLFQQRFQL